MSKPFAFPPPPPPPPPPKPAQSQQTYQQPATRGGQRGRGAPLHSGQRGQGRGQYTTQDSRRDGHAYPHNSRGSRPNAQRGGSEHTQHSFRPPPSFAKDHQQPYAGQKRNHTAAFDHNARQVSRTSRPSAPPAVPSFGVDLDSLLPRKPDTSASAAAQASRKTNSLGMTPATRGAESDDEDDENEERHLAASITSDTLLQFEYKGEKSMLNTPEEIAAWIAERRKKWPTEAKREVAEKEAEDRKKKWEAEKTARHEAGKAAYLARQEEKQKQKVEKEKSSIRQRLLREQIQKAKVPTTSNSQENAAQQKAERLRRKAEKIAQQLKIAEAALDKPSAGAGNSSTGDNELDSLLAQVDTIASAQEAGDKDIDVCDSVSDVSDNSTSQSDISMHDDTSTSGSSSDSDMDADDPPEESSSKRVEPDRVLLPSRKPVPGGPASTDVRQLCKNFSQTGRCKFGRKCHFKHEKPAKKEESTLGSRRKGLYQLMVEKEQEEERARALKAIIALGDAGLLDDDKEAVIESAVC